MNFFEEFRKLALAQPHNAITARAVQNATFGDYLFRAKNIYLSYFLSDAEDCYYSDNLMNVKDCVDCSHVAASELAYECVDCSSLYNCSFLQDCHGSSHCDFSMDLLNCKDCFGSVGLRHRQFCIFNKQYPEQEYRKKRAELMKNPPEKIREILLPEFSKHPRLYARLLKGDENCYGDYIYFSKNCFQCFNVRNIENCAYISEIMNPELSSSDCVDCTFGFNLELCYECQNASMCSNCNFLDGCVSCSDSEYLWQCYNCRNCFGCVYLQNKEYCILNRQFTRDEYHLAVKKIKDELKAAKSYGKALAEVLK